MKLELEQKLINKYPKLYKQHDWDMRQTCMCWGFEVGDGWFDLINELSSKIEPLGAEAVQVKEKFGGLRFYFVVHSDKPPTLFNNLEYKIRSFMCYRGFYKLYWKLHTLRKKLWRSNYEIVEDLVAKAEKKSYEICEACGAPGKVNSKGWISVRCEACKQE